MNTVSRFVKEGQSVWNSKSDAGKVSGALVQETMSVSETGFVQSDKNIFWVKANNETELDFGLKLIEAQLKSGVKKLYKVYSKTPFYEGQTSDINPKTGEVLGRYSEVRVGLFEDATKLHKQYIDSIEPKSLVVAPASTTEETLVF